MLKQLVEIMAIAKLHQPPSGGCVLKLGIAVAIVTIGVTSRLRAAVC